MEWCCLTCFLVTWLLKTFYFICSKVVILRTVLERKEAALSLPIGCRYTSHRWHLPDAMQDFKNEGYRCLSPLLIFSPSIMLNWGDFHPGNDFLNNTPHRTISEKLNICVCSRDNSSWSYRRLSSDNFLSDLCSLSVSSNIRPALLIRIWNKMHCFTRFSSRTCTGTRCFSK